MLLNDSLGVERNSVPFNFRFCTMLYSIITSLTKARAIRILFNSIKIFSSNETGLHYSDCSGYN